VSPVPVALQINHEEMMQSLVAAFLAIRQRRSWRRAILTAVCCAALTATARAQDYPTETIRVLSSTFPGGVIDLLARTFASRLQERSHQTTVVENTTIATGTIGVAQAAKWPPDGYSLLVGHAANMSILPILNPKLNYDPRRDFIPIALLGRAANMLLVPKDSPITSVQDLIARAKAAPGQLTYASQGLGSTAHLATEQFKLITGVDITHVPYRGAAPAATALVAGQISMMIDTVPGNLAQVRAGNLRALAVGSTERATVLPDVPTMAEAGVPGVEGGLWVGLFVPARTPQPIVSYLSQQAQDIFSQPEVREPLEAQGLILPKGSPEDFARFLAAEDQRWREVITRARIEFPQ
jgi:tripartite-type tricarboxylate transporter receptor subunit TctC